MTNVLRLVRDDDVDDSTALSDDSMALADDPIQASPGTSVESRLERTVDALQNEINSLSDEIGQLRRRDEMLKSHMLRIDEELRLAARLQQDFLPKSLPRVGPVRFHTLYRPAGYVSGDLYDVFRLDEHHVGFYIADAVGHGVPAALLTMFIKNALVTKEIKPDGYRLLSPGEALARLNETLVSQNLSQATFATALYGLIDTQSLELTFARAGHPHPLLLWADADRRATTVETEGALLGIFAGETFAETSVRLSPGDRFFVHTDGIEVAFAKDIATDGGQWLEELNRRRSMDSDCLLEEFGLEIDREHGSLMPKDDLTVILLEIERASDPIATSP